MNTDRRLATKAAFYQWHYDHRSQPHADMCRDFENANDSGYPRESLDWWLIALGSAHQAFADYCES